MRVILVIILKSNAYACHFIDNLKKQHLCVQISCRDKGCFLRNTQNNANLQSRIGQSGIGQSGIGQSLYNIL